MVGGDCQKEVVVFVVVFVAVVVVAVVVVAVVVFVDEVFAMVIDRCCSSSGNGFMCRR